jgi:hypothetical protein
MACKAVAAAVVITAVAAFTFTYVAVNAICADDHWPDWA